MADIGGGGGTETGSTFFDTSAATVVATSSLAPAPAPTPSASTQPATPSGTVSSASALTVAPNTLASLLAGLSGNPPTPPGALNPTATAFPVTQQMSAGGGRPSLLLFGLLAVAVVLAYLWYKKHHAQHGGEGHGG